MNSRNYSQRVEAHEEAAVAFANALKRSFPAVAEQITEDAVISFHGTLSGRDVICTFEQVREEKAGEGLKFSRHYAPTSPEVIDRRKRLFEAIHAGRSGDSARAMRELARRYSRSSRKS